MKPEDSASGWEADYGAIEQLNRSLRFAIIHEIKGYEGTFSFKSTIAHLTSSSNDGVVFKGFEVSSGWGQFLSLRRKISAAFLETLKNNDYATLGQTPLGLQIISKMQNSKSQTPIIEKYDPDSNLREFISEAGPRFSSLVRQGEWKANAVGFLALFPLALIFMNKRLMNSVTESTETAYGPLTLYYAGAGLFGLFILPVIAASLLKWSKERRRRTRVRKWLGASAQYEAHPQPVNRYRLMLYISVWSGFFFQLMFPLLGSVNTCGVNGGSTQSDAMVDRLTCATKIIWNVATFGLFS